MSTRAERLDRLPFTWLHRRVLVLSGLGWALDAMDVGLVSFVMAALAREWQLTPGQLGWVGAIGFLGMALGAGLGGTLADRWGRRTVFSATLLLFGFATGAAAASPGLGVLLVFRFLVGLGLGAELPVASTLVSEFAPASMRGRAVVLLEAFWAVGWILAAIIGTFVVSASPNGWRWALLIGGVPALYSAVIRRSLPESVRFLEQKGRSEEAEAVVRSFEQAAGSGDVAPGPAETVRRPPVTEAPRMRDLWSQALRRRTLGLWLTWFGINFAYYGAFIWLPTLLVGRGLSMVRSFSFTLIITVAQLPGYALAAWLIERWGRRPTLILFLSGSAVAAGLFGLAGSQSAVLAAGCLLSFFNLGAWGALYAATPEVYPTTHRATGAGWAAGFGRIASILAPLMVPVLNTRGGLPLVFATLSAFFAVAIAGATLLPEYKGRQLEEAG